MVLLSLLQLVEEVAEKRKTKLVQVARIIQWITIKALLRLLLESGQVTRLQLDIHQKLNVKVVKHRNSSLSRQEVITVPGILTVHTVDIKAIDPVMVLMEAITHMVDIVDVNRSSRTLVPLQKKRNQPQRRNPRLKKNMVKRRNL